jgi:DNA-binding response OmpR family regulator
LDLRKILVCDDEPSILNILDFSLTADGYRVIQANDGDEALALAIAEVPDLVILDVMMPRRNGFEVCRALKARRETADVPVMLLTARGRSEDRELGREAGADAHMTKPFSPQRLLEKVSSLLGVRHA